MTSMARLRTDRSIAKGLTVPAVKSRVRVDDGTEGTSPRDYVASMWARKVSSANFASRQDGRCCQVRHGVRGYMHGAAGDLRGELEPWH